MEDDTITTYCLLWVGYVLTSVSPGYEELTIYCSDDQSLLERCFYTMVVGDGPQMSSIMSETIRNAPYNSHRLSSSSSYPRHHSTSATPTQSANIPEEAYASTPIAIPSSRDHPRDYAHEAALTARPSSNALYGYDQSGFPLSNAPRGLAPSPPSPPSPRLQPTQRSAISLSESATASPGRIKVRDLTHIQSFASEEVLTRSRHGSKRSLRNRHEVGQQYEISAMPVTDIIEMVAGLLTKITSTNDRQHEHVHKHFPPPEGTTGLSQQATSVLAFHGKNVPSITILSYLSRIHKYCPTTYEVFLSLLVYFDRMTETVNNGSLQSFQEDLERDDRIIGAPKPTPIPGACMTATPPLSGSLGPTGRLRTSSNLAAPPTSTSEEADAYNLSHYFVVDSFNIHRLVIAGVTCASKFFSDVFYTNSRYAKVGRLYPHKTHDLLITGTGRRSTSCRVESPRIAIPITK